MCYGHDNQGYRDNKCEIRNGEGYWCTILSRCAVSTCTVGFMPRGAKCVCDRAVNKYCTTAAATPEDTQRHREEHELIGIDDPGTDHTLAIVVVIIFMLIVMVLIFEASKERFSFKSQPAEPPMASEKREPLLKKNQSQRGLKPIGYRIFPKLV